MKRDTFLSPAFRRTARPIDEPAALAMLREGVPARRVARTFGVRGVRVLELARANGIELRPGKPARPFDEARALELLRAGTPAYKVRAVVGGGMRRIVALARENGIELHRRRTDAELRQQAARICAAREIGRSWEQIAEALGYENAAGALWSIRRRAVRAGAETNFLRHARRLRSIFAGLFVANDGHAGFEDVPSFLRMAANERQHWLLRPEEIELARRYRLLPERCMDVPASALIERSLNTPPATPRPRINLFASNF